MEFLLKIMFSGRFPWGMLNDSPLLPLSFSFNHLKRGIKRHSQANCSLACRRFGRDVRYSRGRELADPDSEVGFKSQEPTCQQVARGEIW